MSTRWIAGFPRGSTIATCAVRESTIESGQRYRTLRAPRVSFLWWYDTLAIADDISDGTDGGLPAGSTLTVVESYSPDDDRVRCELDDTGRVRQALLPKRARGWLSRFCLGSKVVGFRVEPVREQLTESCETVR